MKLNYLLIIEPVSIIRKMFEKQGHNQGLKVHTETGEAPWIYLIDDLRPQLLLLDIELFFSGDFKEIQDVSTQIPVVLSGFPQQFEKELANSRMLSFGQLRKPYSPTDIFNRLEKFLD